jgi:hypothetical protein
MVWDADQWLLQAVSGWEMIVHSRMQNRFAQRRLTLRYPQRQSPISATVKNGGSMSNTNHFRKWAAQVARQAGEEPDAAEAQRLLSIAEYWVRLADGEESSQSVAGVGLTETLSR